MSTHSSRDIQALIDSGHLTEAGTLLTMHGELLPPQTREELESRRQQLWNRAATLIAQGEEHEVQGNNREAQDCYQQAAKIAVDFPGLQERRKQITETLALTDAVRLRSKRIRSQGEQIRGNKPAGSSGAKLFWGVLLLALAGGGWWYMQQQPPQAPSVRPSLEAPAGSQFSQAEQHPMAQAPPQEEQTATPPPAVEQERIPPSYAPTPAPVTELGEEIQAATTERVEQAEADARELVQNITAAQEREEEQVLQQASEPAQPLAAEPRPVVTAESSQPLPPVNETQAVQPAEELTELPAPAQDAVAASPETNQAPVETVPPSAPVKEIETVTQPQPAPSDPPLYYTVKPGDSLSKITKRILCNMDAWPELYTRNKKLIDNPEILLPGTRLNLQGMNNLCPKKQDL